MCTLVFESLFFLFCVKSKIHFEQKKSENNAEKTKEREEDELITIIPTTTTTNGNSKQSTRKHIAHIVGAEERERQRVELHQVNEYELIKII